jgi:hypothetical protein
MKFQKFLAAGAKDFVINTKGTQNERVLKLLELHKDETVLDLSSSRL